MSQPLIEVVVNANNVCGEAPTWDAEHERLIWTDNESNKTYTYNAATGAHGVLSEGLMVAGIALNRDGRLAFCGAAGLHLWSSDGSYSTVLAEHEGQTLFFNDMIADHAGRLYAGTLYWGAEGMERTGRLYRIEPDGRIHVEDDGILLSNGLAFSPDDRTLYYVDSAARTIYAYDVDAASGALLNRRVAAKTSGDDGIPDGLTVDAEGFLWCAMWYGGCILRLDPDGKEQRRIAMPALQVSSVAFGGRELTDLYVTSAGASWRSHLAPAGYDFDAPNMGGALYRVRLDIAGLPQHKAALR